MYTVLIHGLEFYAYHGVPAEERVLGHRYRLDLVIEVEGKADETDHISDTVDYGQASKRAVEIAQGSQCHTVEKLAKLIGQGLLDDNSLAREVVVTLVKRLPPAPVIAEEAGVSLTVTR